jgi:hypothetical protein
MNTFKQTAVGVLAFVLFGTLLTVSGVIVAGVVDSATQAAEPAHVVKSYGIFEGTTLFGVIVVYSDGKTRVFTGKDDPALVADIIKSGPGEALVLPTPPCQTIT